MAHVSTTIRAADGLRGPGPIRRILLGLCAARQRRQLAELDDALLRDIGLTPEEARAEARRPVWDVPQTWLR